MALGTRRPALLGTALALVLASTLLVPGPAEARPGRARSTVSLQVSAGSVLIGQSVTMAGRVRPAKGPAAERRTVKVQIRGTGGGWRALAKLRASRSGRYSVTVAMTTAGHFKVRAVVKKTRTARSGTSGKKDLDVSLQPSAVAATWPGDGAVRTADRVVTGAVAPAGETRTVALQRQVPGTWATMATGSADPTTGAYRIPIPTGVLGRWNLRVVVAATPTAAAAESRKPGPFAVTPDWPAAGRARDHAFIRTPLHRWNPCTPIRYRVNARRATPGALADVKQAVHRLTLATGLRFQYDGATTAVPQSADQDFGETHLVVAWATPQQSTYLDGFAGAAGVGGASRIYGTGFVDGAGRPVAAAVQGKVVLNSARNDEVRAGAGKGATRVALLMHEIAHVVGLDHARTRSQIMFRSLTDGEDWWGNGDLAGLRRLGADQGCLFAAGTQPGAVRSTARALPRSAEEGVRRP